MALVFTKYRALILALGLYFICSQELQKSGFQFTFLALFLTYAIYPSIRKSSARIYPYCPQKQNAVFCLLLSGFVVPLVFVLYFVKVIG